MDTKEGLSSRTTNFLIRRSWWIIVAFLAITVLLVVPLLAMGNDEDASNDPSGEVFDLRDDIDDLFPSPIHGATYVVESRDGDILTQAGLWELYRNEQKLREADQRGELHPDGLPAQPYLYQAFDTDTNRPFVGVNTIADALQGLLVSDPRFSTTLEDATYDQVKLAVHHLLSDPATSELRETFSVQATSERRLVAGEEIDYWTSPALVFNVLAENDKLGGGSLNIGVGGGETVEGKEEFNRNVQEILRGEQDTFRLWGVAIDLNLESADEGQTAGMFIMFTVIAAVVIVGLSLRSYWAMALTGAGTGILMIWLTSISNMIGIKGGLVIELIVPIAMISLGVDFAVHALRRYQEEKRVGYTPRRALQVGLAGVMGALVLAMFSDSIAFLANASSGIEAVIHFGVAAAIAVASSLIVLGVILPLIMMQVDQLRVPRQASPSKAGRFLTIFNSIGVAVLSGTSVIFLVAVSEVLGIVVLLATIVGFLVVPLLLMWRRKHRDEPMQASPEPMPSPPQPEAQGSWLVAAVAGLARYRPAVLLVTAVITVAAVLAAIKLEPTFDVKDFFDSRSNFVVSLDKLDLHVAERGGEPATIYIEGDLTQPEALAIVQRFTDSLSDNPYIGRNADGEPNIVELNVFDILRRITASDYARGRVAAVTGVEIGDANGDGLPDSQRQIKAAYDYAVLKGVPLDESTTVYSPGEVNTVLFHKPQGAEDNVAALSVGIPGTREQSTVKSAREALEEDLKVLGQSPVITRFGLTGSPFTREAQLDATTKTLQTSLPIAAAGALVLLIVAMRSFRYAVVTIIPIGLVVAWLYAFMYITGFALNFVTATIGAVSIGVGIDYSIHMTERFREELRRRANKMEALRHAASGTGVALLASAASSIVGFSIMGFAPMPLFSTYGFLTASMIFLALVASLAVLPSLLLLVTPEKQEELATSPAAAD